MVNHNNRIKRIFLFRRLSILMFLLALIPSYFWESPYNPVTILMLTAGVIFALKFRCPYCGHLFNPKTRKDELVYCPKCGHELDE